MPSDGLISALAAVRQGIALAFNKDSIRCPGGKRHAGFAQAVMPDFEYFLSCGIPGKLRGERYKKSPELVKQAMKHAPTFEAPAPLIVFKRWDMIEKPDNSEVAVFFAQHVGLNPYDWTDRVRSGWRGGAVFSSASTSSSKSCGDR